MRPPFAYIVTKIQDAFHWRLIDGDKRVIAVGPNGYPTLEDCRRAIEVVRGSWRAPVEEETANGAT